MLPPVAASASAARSFIQDLLIDQELLYLVEDVRLVTSELATNAIRHAMTSFKVLLEGLSDSIRLTVSDGSERRPVLCDASVLSEAGRGLHVVDRYSHAWGVSQGKGNAKSVWASFDLRAAPGPQLRLVSDSQPGRTEHRPAVSNSPLPRPTGSSLARLLNEVQLARSGLRDARSSGRAEQVPWAQAHLVASLKQYVETLHALRLPVPYALRDELRIYGGTLPASAARRFRTLDGTGAD